MKKYLNFLRLSILMFLTSTLFSSCLTSLVVESISETKVSNYNKSLKNIVDENPDDFENPRVVDFEELNQIKNDTNSECIVMYCGYNEKNISLAYFDLLKESQYPSEIPINVKKNYKFIKKAGDNLLHLAFCEPAINYDSKKVLCYTNYYGKIYIPSSNKEFQKFTYCSNPYEYSKDVLFYYGELKGTENSKWSFEEIEWNSSNLSAIRWINKSQGTFFYEEKLNDKVNNFKIHIDFSNKPSAAKTFPNDYLLILEYKGVYKDISEETKQVDVIPSFVVRYYKITDLFK